MIVILVILGDVFTCRNAGNLFRHTVAASVEYAVFELGVKVVVVMGHEGCGAVKAARAPMVQIAHQPKVMCNAAAQVRKILAEEHLRVLVDSGDLLVVAAFYATSSGIVDFIEVDRHWTDLGHGGQPAHDTAHRRSC
ncbi:carbonic anhydrase [Pavlovales sp. CCMP2436]|nr:carbonic anhydrase [Pavlovales sp. CCMP2436]